MIRAKLPSVCRRRSSRPAGRRHFGSRSKKIKPNTPADEQETDDSVVNLRPAAQTKTKRVGFPLIVRVWAAATRLLSAVTAVWEGGTSAPCDITWGSVSPDSAALLMKLEHLEQERDVNIKEGGIVSRARSITKDTAHSAL